MAGSSQTNIIVKAFGIFTGVQFLSVLCRLISNKVVAVFIGPVGIGLLGLFNQAVEMISTIAQLGINQSGTRAISAAPLDKQQQLARIVRRLSLGLGFIGALVTLLIAPLLSRWSFGTDEYTWAFRVLSFSILFTTVTNGEIAIFQGLRHLRRYAIASLWGVFMGVICAVPVYYFKRIDGIVPCIIIFSLCNFLAMFFARKRTSDNSHIPLSTTISASRHMIVLGVYLTISYAVTTVLAYVFRTYLNTHYDTETVGYFQAGYTIINNYFGIIFTSITVEYFPRLSASISHPKRASVLVSHEISIILWIIIVIATLFVAFADFGVMLLYSSSFLVIIPFITLAMVGVLFKAVSWCLAIVMLARADGKVYMATEIISDLIGFALYILCFSLWGLVGLGIAYTVWYFLYMTMTAIIYRGRYHMTLGRHISLLIAFAVGIVILAILAKVYVGWWAALIVSLATVYPAIVHISRK